MSITSLIFLTAGISILLMVFGFGLKVSLDDVTSLLREPGRLLRAIIAMNVVLPLCAVVLVLRFELPSEIEFIIVAFALSPVPPFLPGTQVKAGGDTRHVAGLLTASCLLSIITVPLTLLLLSRFVSHAFAVPYLKVAAVVLLSALAPLAAGLAMHHLAPAMAARLQKPVDAIATLLLAAGGLAIVAAFFRPMLHLLHDGALLAIAAIVVLGLAVGFLFGGPATDDRVVLALATAARHPGVALAIAGSNFTDQQALLAATSLYLIVSTLVTAPFALWHGHRHAGAAAHRAGRLKPVTARRSNHDSHCRSSRS